MRSQNSHSGRRSRRGPRRPSRPGSSYSSSPKQKKTLWQKIIAFFAGSPSSKPALKSSSSTPIRGSVSRKPEVVEVNSPKLYVGNLSFDATESDLFELFNGVGQVRNAEVVSNRYTQKSKGFAFVTMQSVDEARRAVSELHDKDFMGRKLVVSGAKTNDVSASRDDAAA